MKKFNVKVVETLSKVVEVKAETIEEAEKIVTNMYDNEEIVLDSGDYDNNVEFYSEYVDPTSLNYIAAAGWDWYTAEYLFEMFNALKEAGVKFTDEELYQIIDDSECQEFIGIYDEKYFDMYIEEYAEYSFKYLKPGMYDAESGFYKTKDNEFIMEVRL